MKRYPKEVKDFIAKNVAGTTTKDLVELVNAEFDTDFTESKMRSYKTNNKLKSGTPHGLPVGHATEAFPMDSKNFIAKNHKEIGPKEMTELLNKNLGTKYTTNQIRGYYKNHKINSGLKGHFSKGHVPFNKGKKGLTLGGVQTQYKKGHKAHNWAPLGTERISGDGYIDVKIQDGKLQKNWKGKHVLIWEQHNGPVPRGHGVIFGDGNNRNFDLNNLILVSRKQLMMLNKNKLIQNDADLTKTAVIIIDLILKISERKKAKRRINVL